MSAPRDVLRLFKQQILRLLDDLVEQIPEEGRLILLRVLIASDQIPSLIIQHKFIEKILPYKKDIKRRDTDTFLKVVNAFLMSLLTDLEAEVDFRFEDIWHHEYLDEEDHDAIWRYFYSFIDLSEKYLEADRRSRTPASKVNIAEG